MDVKILTIRDEELWEVGVKGFGKGVRSEGIFWLACVGAGGSKASHGGLFSLIKDIADFIEKCHVKL